MAKSNIPLQNVFTESSRKAIEGAAAILASSRQNKESGAAKDIVSIAKEEVASSGVKGYPAPGADSSQKVRELEGKIKELREALDSNAVLIDKLVQSQNEVIKEINEMKKKVAQCGNSSSNSSSSSMPSTAPHSGAALNTGNIEPKHEETQQQNGNGQGLDPSNFSVEKTFYFGKK